MANIFPQILTVDKDERSKIKNQLPLCLWFTGLSGSGKSTIANALERRLVDKGKHTFLIDGDNLRMGLCKDLNFTEADRTENIRRAAEISSILIDAGLIVIVSLISPMRSHRILAKNILSRPVFFEIFIDTPINICESRDTKGLYKKAKSGEIKNFTGVSSPYEVPQSPDIHIKTSELNLTECVNLILEKLKL